MGEIIINPIHNVHKNYRKVNLINPYIFAPIITGLYNSVIAAYKLETSGLDSKNGYNGNVGSSITFSSGVSGNAANFDGTSNSVITIADNNVFSFTDGTSDLPFSFKFNIKFNVLTSQFIVDKCINGAGATEEWRVDLTAGKIRILLIDKLGGKYIGKVTSNTMSINVNYNIIITYSGNKTSSGIKIYIDGVLAAMTDANSGIYTGMGNNTLPIRIGKPQTSEAMFNGQIDEFYIFNKELTPAEITTLQTNYFPNF